MRLFEGQRDLLGSYLHHLVGLTHSPIRFIKLQHKNKVLTRSISLQKCSAISLWYQKMSLYPNSNDSPKAPDRMDGRADKTTAGSSIWLCSAHLPLQLFLRKYCCAPIMISQPDTSKVMHHKDEQCTAKWILKISKNENYVIYSPSCRFKPLQNSTFVWNGMRVNK